MTTSKNNSDYRFVPDTSYRNYGVIGLIPHTACAFSVKQHGVVSPNSRVPEHRKSFSKDKK